MSENLETTVQVHEQKIVAAEEHIARVEKQIQDHEGKCDVRHIKIQERFNEGVNKFAEQGTEIALMRKDIERLVQMVEKLDTKVSANSEFRIGLKAGWSLVAVIATMGITVAGLAVKVFLS